MLHGQSIELIWRSLFGQLNRATPQDGPEEPLEAPLQFVSRQVQLSCLGTQTSLNCAELDERAAVKVFQVSSGTTSMIDGRQRRL